MSKYQMPQVQVSESVQWLREHNAEPMAAIVTSVAEDTIECTVFPRGFGGGLYRAGVRHVSDPNHRPVQDQEDIGVWRRVPSVAK